MTQDLKKLVPQAKATIHTPVAVETPGITKKDGETIPRRNVKAADKLVMNPSDGVNTLYDVLRYSAKTFGNAKAVGSRQIVDVHTETKKIKKMIEGKETEVDKNWQFYELSSYEFKTFNDFERVCLEIGSALKHLGFQPEDRLHLYAATSAQWLSSAHGAYFRCFHMSTSVLTSRRRLVAIHVYRNSVRHARRGRPYPLYAADQGEGHVHRRIHAAQARQPVQDCHRLPDCHLQHQGQACAKRHRHTQKRTPAPKGHELRGIGAAWKVAPS
jgi:hypothetical protein